MGHSPASPSIPPIIETNRYIGVRMSRDQKPGRVRVVSGSLPATPMRRATDRAALGVLEGSITAAPTEAARDGARASGLLLPSLLFLLGCAIGGIAFASLGLF